jgi:hypothetical protein
VAWRLRRMSSGRPRAMGLLAVLISFWILTAIGRAWLGLAAAYSSRYIYVGGLLLILLAAELMRGASLPRVTAPLLAIAVVAAAVSNLGAFRDSAAYLRGQAQLTRADLGALDITRGIVTPGYVSTLFPGAPFVTLRAGPYFSAERAMGTPADTPAELATAPEPARMDADTELVQIHGVRLEPSSGAPLGARPTVDSVAGGAVSGSAACTAFRPATFTPGAPAANDFILTVPASGLVVRAEGGSAAVSVRRFADEFHPLGEVAAGGTALVRIARDQAPQPWHLQVAPTGSATVCGVK